MSEERYKLIKENVYTRCHIVEYTGIGLSFHDKEEIELIDYVEELKDQLQQKENIIKEVREYIEMHTPSDIGICDNKTKRYYTLGEDSVDHILEILGRENNDK